MATSKKRHPADDFNATVIANATEWTAFMQAGGRITNRHATREAAVADAQRLANEYQRPALVYAINPEGRSALADTVNPGAPTPAEITTEQDAPKSYAKKFNAQRAARASGLKDGTFEIVETEAGFTFRAIQAKPKRKPELPNPQNHAIGKRAKAEEAARDGNLPPAPDFSADTHARFRKKLAELTALVAAGDVAALRAFPINPVSTSPKAMDRYRNLAVIALEARAAKKAAA